MPSTPDTTSTSVPEETVPGPPDPDDATEQTEAPALEITLLTEPADGVPDVLTTNAELARAVRQLSAGTGPVAVDAERASGYRYGQRTYLVQLRREGTGTVLIDPVPLPDLSTVSDALEGVEWIFHAASQDLPGLAEQNLHASRVFDTELGARLLGLDRVGLAAVVAELLGLGLAKEHSAVDWSTRPLPDEWLRYAALDVEVLIELRNIMAARLEAAGKLGWAEQEFEAVRTMAPPAPRVDPWRRVHGVHGLRDRRMLAVVRELWIARDRLGQSRDIAPGRVLPDRAIIAAATALPRSVGELTRVHAFGGPATRRRAALWQRAIDIALALPESELPDTKGPRTDAPPPPKVWADRDPDAAARLAYARAGMARLSEAHSVPLENLLQPDLLRRVCWRPPAETTLAAVEERLREGGARAWQVELTAGLLFEALGEHA
ncbi:ribonuclease D [Sanguibacter antarcticus]|uniref:Ribonuclease D n=1 Tax=Sanguibacter antarcticus TaxID=372484 RepID=A0A2A9E459_9MICO|nr:ribonuclease D [Sanguibacter antarcticus]PFG32980.1 ribonuclease D [Sanguibacter antarcticus]